MKKATPLLALFLIALMFTSCRKDFTCVCTTTKSVRNHHRVTKVKYELSEFKKKNAQYSCQQRNRKYLEADGVTHTQVFCRVD
jgi:hypothetical protein